MKVSIIICTRNRADSLAQTLKSLENVTVPATFGCEILVVDNGSTDATLELVRQWNARLPSLSYLLEASAGQARARNAGLSKAAGDILIFTDDDVRFRINWLQAICDPILEAKGHAVAGQVKLAPHLERNWMGLIHRSWCASTERLDPRDPSDMVGASMAFHRSVLKSVPGFDNELGPGASGFADDTLFSWQLKQAGFRIAGAPEAEVVHHFDEKRLLRKNWLAAAKKMGRSFAYINYHWGHKEAIRPHVRFWRAFARYYFWRILKSGECSAAEGISLRELELLERLHRARHFMTMRNSPRNYSRQGLLKRQAN